MKCSSTPGSTQQKKCGRCGETKTTDEFYSNKARYDGYGNYCKMCSNLATLENYRDNRDRRLLVRKEYYDATLWTKNLKKKYGLTEEGYAGMLHAQVSGCAICGVPENVAGKRLAVDHCHATGEVRGLLCSRCNTALGGFQDETSLLKIAAAYLEAQRDS